MLISQFFYVAFSAFFSFSFLFCTMIQKMLSLAVTTNAFYQHNKLAMLARATSFYIFRTFNINININFCVETLFSLSLSFSLFFYLFAIISHTNSFNGNAYHEIRYCLM